MHFGKWVHEWLRARPASQTRYSSAMLATILHHLVLIAHPFSHYKLPNPFSH